MALSRARQWNPLAFNRWPVTVIITVLYVALLVPILVVEHVLPSAPSSTDAGLDIDEAWLDLQHLTREFHPYNAHNSDEVRSWLLTRIEDILRENKSPSSFVDSTAADQSRPQVFVFDDNQSNLTIVQSNLGVYFEGTNIMVYIRGRDDDKRNWWETPGLEPSGRGGVLVNAHYDSVATGYGATDDGVGVVSCLQLIKYFTTPGHEPLRGLVVLFNNGEEDFLNGARVYSQHPISKLPHTFLNLEGAGAGGRATLFRTSDTEVARSYQRSPYPFGTVFSDAGFKLGMIRSQTDYVVFEGDLGLRGLDVAFMEPRARYHTNQDDSKHTSLQSLWHMLSAAVATTEGLVFDSSDDFEGRPQGPGKVPSGKGSQAVWFDLFGATFAVFELHTLFALSVTLLIVGPLALLITSIILANSDRMYLFGISISVDEGFESVPLRGWRGFTRFPFIFVTTTAGTVALAFLFAKVNPLIAHSSEYAVWSTMISAWVFLAWFLSRIANFVRPSALHRVYVLTWMFVLTWVLLVVATVFENRDDIASGYFMIFYTFGIFLATWISYLELFALPKKSEYASQFGGQASRRASSSASRLLTPSAESAASHQEDEGEPSESTSLLRGRRTTFANYTRVENNEDGQTTPGETEGETDIIVDANVYGFEQGWSAKLPTWTWILQFLLIAPIVIILVAQLGLLVTAGVHQTGQDGSSVLSTYLLIAIFTTLLFTPTLPFLHRFTYHVPTFLFFVFTATLIYNLVAFPFSSNNRLKLFFVQEVDIDTGVNHASLTGIPPFVQDAVSSIPSAHGQNTSCVWKADRMQCSWEGLTPHVLLKPDGLSEPPMEEWVRYSAKRVTRDDSKNNDNKNHAQIQISGLDTRGCILTFDNPITTFHVAGSAVDETRFPINITPEGIHEIRLWSRTWENEWTVDVEWNPDDTNKKLTGKAICFWSDANTPGLIPALDEVIQYSPDWVAITKLEPGLAKASRSFAV